MQQKSRSREVSGSRFMLTGIIGILVLIFGIVMLSFLSIVVAMLSATLTFWFILVVYGASKEIQREQGIGKGCCVIWK